MDDEINFKKYLLHWKSFIEVEEILSFTEKTMNQKGSGKHTLSD